MINEDQKSMEMKLNSNPLVKLSLLLPNMHSILQSDYVGKEKYKTLEDTHDGASKESQQIDEFTQFLKKQIVD